MMDASVLRLHEYRVKKFLLVMCRFHLFKRVHLVFPCQILLSGRKMRSPFPMIAFCHLKSEGGNDKYCCCIAASSSLSSSIGRWGGYGLKSFIVSY